ncbi:hypothetical protein PF005_g7961 [Phytophthora fragariae]|uniref:Uncharacterized protein n=2 Tax=Phytophthora TaxID=4783 RepID=A0A6A3ZSF7_9STRA|nr:hypothetical protein PF003_g33284 [Phytophthora fragariae]KAE9037128.1 hypothetical protein PR002_g6733 [Phytophthora rubi]KAE8941496.1 hypothetical protein PF009_g8706 [Phytophthora fragariae]KAE9041498.1 hypothetical protein PR001_g6589 [Phytophthora rubi]KAE9120272.1 hypothetical protein PF007_g8232 [Phytophthora fragariae]
MCKSIFAFTCKSIFAFTLPCLFVANSKLAAPLRLELNSPQVTWRALRPQWTGE